MRHGRAARGGSVPTVMPRGVGPRQGDTSTSTQRATIAVQSERAVLAAVRLPGSRYDPDNPFGELAALAEQAGAIVVGQMEQQRKRPESGTFIGSGKLEELAAFCEQTQATTIIFDHDLAPKQIGNIERVTGLKVIDRSELILDIFAARATTHEARLQVELAQLEYTYPRLRAMWTHLERIVGPAGVRGVGTRGPGEQQLETDRRLVQKRRDVLRRELARIRARKERAVRKRNTEHFTVGLVGYTNAGKSTLFNTLTAGGAYADDRPFATLITRTRQWDLGGGLSAMLSDTVGFVRDLPHNLIASFRATLEEATHADLLLIVLDVSDPAATRQYETVTRTLDELFERTRGAGSEGDWDPPDRLVLLNKIDRLADNREILIWRQRVADAIPICALPGQENGEGAGHAELRRRMALAVRGEVAEMLVTISLDQSQAVQIIESRSEVLDRRYHDGCVTIRTRIGSRQIDRLREGGARIEVSPVGDESGRASAAAGSG